MMPPRSKAREVYTLDEAADWLRVSYHTVSRLCREGELGFFRIIPGNPKSERLTTLADLRAVVARRRAQTMHQERSV
jgi:excisionase family DNA binding protein